MLCEANAKSLSNSSLPLMLYSDGMPSLLALNFSVTKFNDEMIPGHNDARYHRSASNIGTLLLSVTCTD